MGVESGATVQTGDEGARARLASLFEGIDRLTPAELGRLGYRMASDEERGELLGAIDAAARQTGRVALVDEARRLARDAVMRRYGEGTLNPTWIALNWGISGGTVADRVAIAETLADAAAAAVVADALEPEIAEALALDARDIVGLSTGAASDGALSRVLDAPADPELGPSRGLRRVRLAVVVLAVASVVASIAAVDMGYWPLAILIAIPVAVLIVRQQLRGRG
ncbi:MAG: hypothetical protein WCK58_03575 [Chloroflexota bacterium]